MNARNTITTTRCSDRIWSPCSNQASKPAYRRSRRALTPKFSIDDNMSAPLAAVGSPLLNSALNMGITSRMVALESRAKTNVSSTDATTWAT